MAIDDRLEKIRNIFREGGDPYLGSALQVAGLTGPAFKLLSIVQSFFSTTEREHKALVAILALCDELEQFRTHWPPDWEAFSQASWFKKATATLMEESVRSVDDERARLLARVMAHGCFPSQEDQHRQEDLASYISDLANLGTDDVQMLKMLGTSYKEVSKHSPNLHDPNHFTHHYATFMNEADKLKIHPDDRLAIGARLTGFGLALESPTQSDIGQIFYRPTRRGFYLLSLLEAAELPVQKQN